MPENYNYTDDIILPDGFDPEKGWVDDAAAEAPTTEQVAEPVEQAEIQEAASEIQETPPEQPTTTETEPTIAPETVVKPTTIKVRYNHEDRELGLDEAALLAQKGLNYDKLDEKVKAFEASNAKTLQIAKHLGYDTVDAMMEAAEKNLVETKVRDLVDAGNTEAMARFLVDQEMAKVKVEIPAPAPEPEEPVKPVETPQPKAIPTERMQELSEFVKAYPGITKLPDEVIKDNRNGVRLLVAYERYKNKAALEELAILKQNQAAAAKAPVSGTVGKSAPSEPSVDDDPFMKGFNDGYPRK